MKKTKDFPMEKYKFTVLNDKVVLAETTFMGEKVIGRAKCSPNDDFDVEIGKKLAAARCNVKIAKKRKQRAKFVLQAYDFMMNDLACRTFKKEMIYGAACEEYDRALEIERSFHEDLK